MHFRGSLLAGGHQILSDVEGDYQITNVGGRTDWGGTFAVTAGTFLPPRSYQLLLDDGRRGNIVVQKVSLRGVGAVATFLGNDAPPS